MSGRHRGASPADFRHYRAQPDLSLRNRLVEANLDLVEHHVRRYRGRSESEDDLRQVARLALVRAVERFDPERGIKFTTFAGRTIDGTLKRHFRDRTWAVRPPRRAQELHLEVRRAEDELAQELGRSPTVAELADRLGRSEDEVLEGAEAAAAYRSSSLDRPRPGVVDDATTEGARIGRAEPGFERSDIRLLVTEALEVLPDRQREALRMRYVDDMTQQEIADVLGISQSYLSRLLRQALGALREHLDP